MSDGNIDDRDAPWFPENKFDWRLDVVTLLAVIGEASMAEHSQAITASAFCLLPRLLPAPQAFLNASRPKRLPETKAIVTGVYSGVTLDSVSFFANILIPLDLPPYAFKVWEIKHVNPHRQNSANSKASSQAPTSFYQKLFKRGQKPKVEELEPDVEMRGDGIPKRAAEAGATVSVDAEDEDPAAGGMRRRNTLKEKVAEQTKKAANVIIAGDNFLVSLAILAGAIYWRDGTAILAVSLISLASSIIGYASWWQPQLMSTQGAENRKLPAGDIMIRTREGAFIYIKCDESVARELFSGTEECKYHVSSRFHDALMAAGTMILMLSVVLLGNCKWNSQIFIGASYIVLNGFYWGIGMLPKRYSWNLNRFEIRDRTPSDAQRAHERVDLRQIPPPPNPQPLSPELNNCQLQEKHGQQQARQALTHRYDPRAGSADWAKRSNAAPQTAIWDAWLIQADREARAQNRVWTAVTAKDEMLNPETPI
ncbi:unnamed protein product [Parascedosporium putredinis]|uniref:Uncharacterized protein n=1 Tax=Parascedosporium putredinis TaxID=1442378 RepID=A0A9P1MG36_9PEZI|nr:unnamed protein product [Parascedosporium putredinis]CAI8004710.1 unnamed protein product [Parascedosporium putredinis]